MAILDSGWFSYLAGLRNAGLGYPSGSGGVVTQLVSKSTPVTVNTLCGQITTSAAALDKSARVAFVVNDTLVGPWDVPIVAIANAPTPNIYRAGVTAVGSGAFTITLENLTGTLQSQAVLINFAVLKGAIS